MIRIIINADDLGKSSQVNSKIFEAFQNGYITSSTILGNTDFWEEVHNVVDANPNASFGVHLNLTEGKALTEQPVFRVRGVVDENNCFTNKIREANLYDKELQVAVRQEWNAQIRKVVEEEGIAITHFDGHHHIHADYAFRDTLSALAKEWNVEYVRSKYNYPQKGVPKIIKVFVTNFLPSCWLNLTVSRSSRLFSGIHSFAETKLWRQFISEQCKMTDYFDSYAHFCNLLKKGCRVQTGSLVELMCHPGHPDYEEEYGLIRKNICKSLLSDYEKISYKNV